MLAVAAIAVGAALRRSPSDQSANELAAATPPAAPAAAQQKQPAATEKAVKPSAAAAAPAATVTGRLTQLGKLILARATADGAFPAGVSGNGRVEPGASLSWMAALEAAEQPNGSPLHTDRAWNDPLNDRFVRRAIPRFQNPRIPQLAGADGYPATHFVGMAGVGADAPRLPADHPRAGIFAENRRTKLTDIKDGQTHTILVSGVLSELGSWAAPGPSTMRPFTREPYVNGPDGFGTGEADGMLVLMADGSVRTLASDMPAEQVRRLATIADSAQPGTVPDEPAPAVAQKAGPPPDAPAPAPPPDAPGDAANTQADATLLEAIPKAPPVDVEAALRQRILRFDQSRPAPLRDLLLLVEELVGVPVKYEGADLDPGEAKLDQQISFKLEQATVAQILQAIVKEAGLTYRVEGGHIRVIPSTASRTGDERGARK